MAYGDRQRSFEQHNNRFCALPRVLRFAADDNWEGRGMPPSRLRSLLPALHCMECTVWPTCKRTAFDRRMQCAVDDELSVQLLAADQNLRALHEAKFRIFLASTARQLNLPDDNWQILGVPNFHAIECMEMSANSSFPFTLMGIPLPDDQFVAAYTLLNDKIPQAKVLPTLRM